MQDPITKPIRIWHQATMVLDNFPAFAQALSAHFARLCRPGTHVVTHGTHPATYKTAYPGIDIRHVAVQHFLTHQFMLGALAAEDQGFDAYAISTLPDYALQESRTIVDIPVVAYGESAMLTSCMLGRRFGVMVFIEELAQLVEENVRRYGLIERLAGIRVTGLKFADLISAFDEPAGAIEKLKDVARALIRDGAEAIVPGEAPLCVLLMNNGVSAIDGVPVVDALGATIKMAEALVDLKRVSGVSGCRRGYFGEKPPRQRIEEFLELYGSNHLRPPFRAS
jgi:Asp/Glu/hydantoin racemase